MKFTHAIERALERYGLKLTQKDATEMTRICAAGKSLRLAYLANEMEKHALLYNGKALVVVYKPYKGPTDLANPNYGHIVTILPREAASPGAKGSPATKARGKFQERKKPPKKARQRGIK